MEKYNPKKIEKKWQEKWEEQGIYKVEDNSVHNVSHSDAGVSKKAKKYILVEFPYPSGAGLHVGHCRSYSSLDTFARKKRMEGDNVLFPMGWDAFGLPTENFAIKNKIHPLKATEQNIANFKKQIKSLGLSFDWSREINTTDPKYYKWTQWIFLKLFGHGLAYQAEMPINWCPSCKIGLANEEVVNGKCERCGAATEKKVRKQWMLKITAYADRLIESLEKVDYPERVKAQQVNWIGKSKGATVKFQITNSKLQINLPVGRQVQNSNFQNSKFFLEVFTTRPDTLFGCTYLVVAPEHDLVASLLKSQIPNSNNQSDPKFQIPKEIKIQNIEEIKDYLEKAKRKSDLERTELIKEKTGIELKGIKAINPVNNQEIPIWIADYVLPYYGTGAIMAVPAHDARDYDFAVRYNLPVKKVIIQREDGEVKSSKLKAQSHSSEFKVDLKEDAYEGEGVNINSDFLDGLETKKAKEKITKWLEEKGVGKKAVNYKLRDWVFSRQHYWGEPIPLIFCPACKKRVENYKSKITNSKKIQNSKFPPSFQMELRRTSKIQNFEFNLGEILNPGWIPIPEKDLPVELPYVEKYEPTGTGESPLANVSEWVDVKCPKCGGPAKRETDTMPNWAGSSWYFMRYIDSQNDKALADLKKLKYWMPVDWYNGGMEHTTLHLLYSRFWYKFLFDIGVAPQDEPYKKRTSHGMVLAEDGRKMSKSFGNVINPDDIIKEFGADSLRLYEMFMGPFEQAISWNMQGVVGMRRFLEKIYKLFQRIQISNSKFQINLPVGRQVQNSNFQNSKFNRLLHQTIKKVSNDIDNFKFNTAISQLMILTNQLTVNNKQLTADNAKILLILLSPFAPHLSEEIWHQLGSENSIFKEPWPKYDSKLIKEEKINLIIQINGKVRDKMEVDADISEGEIKKLVLSREKVLKWIKEKKVKKIIFVKGKLLNIVVKK